MKLTIFGSTGNTGLELVKLALDEGHEVVTVVRNPAKLSSIQHEKLQVVEGDIFSTEFLQTHLDGCDAVLSCLGSNSLTQATTIYSGSMKAIVPAMRAAKVSRIIIITSWYVKVDPNDDPGRMARWVIRPMLSKPLNDMAVMAKYLEDECQDIDYTMVLPPQLTNSASTGKDLVFDIGRQFTSKGDHKIPRADVAKFMLQCLKTSDFNKNCVAIAQPPRDVQCSLQTIGTNNSHTTKHKSWSIASRRSAQKLINDCNRNDLFTVIHDLTAKRPGQTLPSHDSHEELPERLCKFFDDKITQLCNPLCNSEMNPTSFSGSFSVLKNPMSSLTCSLETFQNVSEEDMRKRIKSKKIKTCPLDPAPAVVFSNCTDTFPPAITDMVNHSLDHRVFPKSLKSALITPVLKKHNLDPECLNSYRPISNLPFLAKV
ncbi:uncharacterized protein [Diadema antillarum]|uniref:uncharacterized protein n=1 Tax=Diadema antillarum TaxID=105358 RepID=UPI003A86B332